MRSTKGGALDPTQANSSAFPAATRPSAGSSRLDLRVFGPPHDSLLLPRAPTAGEAKYAIRTVRDVFGHQDVRTTVIYTHALDRGGPRVRKPADTPR
jgi:hypothetical protein